jgi:twitching motility protein PilT
MPWDIHALMAEAIRQGASDLHISTGVPPTLRIDGTLHPLELPAVTPEDSIQMIYSILNAEQRVKLETEWELDFSVEVRDIGRFRVNVHRQRGAVEAALRVVHDVIRSTRQLGLPPIVEEIARFDSGLVLITGPTGSGKTSTMAAMIDQMNRERSAVIITIEDPIEYIHSHRRSIVKQREVASDTLGFGPALRHVLRQDPDVISIGEMRDLETIATALTAAETGHLVLATIHTPDTIQTVDRIIDVFPPAQQQQIRMQFASSLQAIVAQQLLAVPGQKGRVVAVEVLIATVAARKVIRSAKTEQLVTVIQTGTEHGMISMDKSLKNLYQQGLISYDDAMNKVKYPEAWDHL